MRANNINIYYVKMHYFIDNSNLPIQNEPDRFGPVSSNPDKLYNNLSVFEINTESKAYACQNGLMIVQQSKINSSLVNVIIKPTNSLGIPLQKVAYYIYRGISKESLISGSILQNFGNDNNDLLKRIYKKNIQAEFNVSNIGYDNNLIADNQDIETIFYNSTIYRPITVFEGEWIGNFKSGKIGFEVIMERDRFTVNLGYARTGLEYIDVSGLSGELLKQKREQVLYNIDPAAFWGLFYNNGISVTIYTNGIKNTKRLIAENLYSEIISKYNSKNTVYLDIRSESGYSYNFYENYGDGSKNNIQIGYGSDALTSKKYVTSEWPIIIFNLPQNNNRNFNTIKFKLRIDDNINPVLFFWLLRDERSNSFLKIKSDSSTTWSKEVLRSFPNFGNGNVKYNIANYIKAFYFRSMPTSKLFDRVFTQKKYYHIAFCSIDIQNIANLDWKLRNVENPNFNYINEPLQTDGTGNFSYSAINGATWDTSKILFYSKALSHNETSEKTFLPTYSQKLTCIKTDNKEIKMNLDIICRNYNRTSSGNASEQIKIIGVNNFKEIIQKESCMFLGITLIEFNALKLTPNLSMFHNRYIYLERSITSPLNDGGNRFFEYTVKVQGWDNTGKSAIVTPQVTTDLQSSPQNIVVYSRDNLFFSSKEFSANEVVTSGSNNICFNTYDDGCIKINDNIDLSLAVGLKRIFYKYHDANNIVHDICNLLLYQSTKMLKGTIVRSNPAVVPANYVETIDYTSFNVEAKYSYANPIGDIVTLGKHDTAEHYQVSYKTTKKKAFLVYFDPSLVNNAGLNISFQFTNTRRRYAKPELAAAIIGVLATVQMTILSGGFSFSDGTCFPSQTHINGEAIDTSYKLNLTSDQRIIDAMHKFGFNTIYKGIGGYFVNLTIATPFVNHTSHLHSANLKLKSCTKAI